MALDTFQDIEARLVAHDYVLKCLINTLNQITPQAGIAPALLQMLDNSVKAINIQGEIDPQFLQEFKARILQHSQMIVTDAVSAKPTTA